MSDSYVTSKATLKCSFGDKTSKLTVYPDRTVFLTENPMANVSDHISMYNIAPFGKCHTTCYPPTGSATAANHGHLTPMPCVPGTGTNWINGKDDYIIKGNPALLKSSYCRCKWGGVITIIDDGQKDTGNPNINQEERQDTILKEIPYTRKLVAGYSPQFTFNEIATGERARCLEQEFSDELSSLFSACENTTNWLGSPVPNKAHYIQEGPSENIGEIIEDPNSGADLDENGNVKILYGGVTFTKYVQIHQIQNDHSGIRDYAKLFLYAFDAVPRIRNTKTSLLITINPLIAGFTLAISVGVDNNYDRYMQLDIKSWIGGDYTDFVNHREIKEYLEKKQYKKAFKKLLKKNARKLSKLIQLKPMYQTCVPQPEYGSLKCGAYIDLNLELDKLLVIRCGTQDATNISDIWENGSVSISSQLTFPGLDVNFGWDSGKLDTNAGFFLDITPKLTENNYPIGLTSIRKQESPTKEFYEKTIYTPNDLDLKVTAELGSEWSYAWNIEEGLNKNHL